MRQTPSKNPHRQLAGAIAHELGKQFETRLDAAFAACRQSGEAMIDKTPEPMRPARALGNGKFVAFYERKAQPDYKGILKGGKAVLFEAKYTASDRIEQSRVSDAQAEYLTLCAEMGAYCFVIAGYSTGNVYCVPWRVWSSMRDLYGRKYVTEADLAAYRVRCARDGTLMILGG